DEVNNEILSVLKEHAGDPSVKGFVITGYGTAAFSAGADIGKFPQTLGNKDAAVSYARDCAQVQLFMDQMEKPVVAAINGMALGGGLEIALRCQSMVAIKNAVFQFPEITLGILPGIGGCIVPYRKWPQGAALFHEMICLARRLNAQEAMDIGMVTKVVDNYSEMIEVAVEEVKNLKEKIKRIPDGSVAIPEITVPEPPMAGKLALSKEAISVTVKTIKQGAAAETFAEALEIGYQGSAEIACTDAAKEGISAFLEKRKPEFKK
ncbi:MAG: enoyl-CoA hydratase/isomerase family protein, partial [Deltaproteobacteria bacterium]